MKEEPSALCRYLAPRLLAWGMTLAGVGLGLVVASLVGEDTPELALWGGVSLGVGATLGATHYFIRRGSSGR